MIPKDSGSADERSLRIAFFSEAYPERNGTGTYYYDLIAHLNDRVAQVEIYQPLPDRRFNLMTMPLPGDRTQQFVIPNPVRLRRAIDRLRPHLCISVTPGFFGIMGMLLAHRHHSGFISAYHTDFAALAELYWGPLKRRFGGYLLNTVTRHLCLRSSTVLVNNNDLISQVRSFGAPHVSIMGTPIEEVFLETPRSTLPRKPDPIVFAGRLAPEKNIDAILNAARRRPQKRFIIAGDGPLRESVERTADELDNLDYRGWLNRKALCGLLDEAGLVILPSRFETFGSIALEAMSRQRPVLITSNAGIHNWPEVADSLCILHPNDILTDVLDRLDTTPESEWTALGQRSRESALALHEATMDHWLQVLRSHVRFDV